MIKRLLVVLLGCTLLLSGCGYLNDTKEEVVETVEETQLEMYYKDNDTINLYLNNYNVANPNNLIEKGSFEKYYHHGKEHDNQITFNVDDYKVVITDNAELEVVIDGSNDKTNDDYKAIFTQYAKGYNVDFSDETLDYYWNQVMDDITNNVEFDEFECRLQMFNDTIEYMQLGGKLK